jgi:hypothetical protein
MYFSFYFLTKTACVIVPYIGVLPKWFIVFAGSTQMLITLSSNVLILMGTSLTGPSFIVIVAVPLDTFVFLSGIDILVNVKLDIWCLYNALPFSITILNTASNVAAGRLFLLVVVLLALDDDIIAAVDVMFVKLPLYKPETIHAGFPSLSFCKLAIVPLAYSPGWRVPLWPEIPPGCCADEYDDGGVDIIIPPPIFVVADNGEANMIAIPNVKAATIPKVKEVFLGFIVIRSRVGTHISS